MNFDDYEALLWYIYPIDKHRPIADRPYAYRDAEYYQVDGLRAQIFEQLRHVRRDRVMRYLNLTNLTLAGVNLAGVDFTNVNLTGMDLYVVVVVCWRSFVLVSV
jgi:hypothetical protein